MLYPTTAATSCPGYMPSLGAYQSHPVSPTDPHHRRMYALYSSSSTHDAQYCHPHLLHRHMPTCITNMIDCHSSLSPCFDSDHRCVLVHTCHSPPSNARRHDCCHLLSWNMPSLGAYPHLPFTSIQCSTPRLLPPP